MIALRDVGPGAIGPLVEPLDDPHPSVRGRAVEALGGLRAIAAQPRITRLLSDPDGDVRHAAKRALEQLAPVPVQR